MDDDLGVKENQSSAVSEDNSQTDSIQGVTSENLVQSQQLENKAKFSDFFMHNSEYKNDIFTSRYTSIINFFNALSQSLVVYDPADEIYENGTPKSRSQWRVNVSIFEKKMNVFYNYIEEINLTN